ncbi:MAG: D-aminoacyl-tRNA deacylase [Dehalococcoidia bacterium]
MRAVAQRVLSARVTVDGVETGAIGPGLLVYLGITHDDNLDDARWLARKLADARLFEGAPSLEAGDAPRPFERSLTEVGGSALVVSQFTLYADIRRGRRPSFTAAARPEAAAPLVEAVMRELEGLGVTVAGGRFGSHMLVESVNDGPVTILFDTADRERPRSV